MMNITDLLVALDYADTKLTTAAAEALRKLIKENETLKESQIEFASVNDLTNQISLMNEQFRNQV